MKIIKAKSTYVVSEGNYAVYVKVYGSGRMSVQPFAKGNAFHFQHSKPELIRAVGKLIMKSADIKL